MDIELGIQNVARTVTFSTDATEEEVNERIKIAIDNNNALELTDDKGRTIFVPAGSLGYAIVGSQTRHTVGFGVL